MYFVRTPYIIKKLFPQFIWDLPNAENKIYLTFDDGPHPEITPWILEQLTKYNAKATFFCLGKKVEKYPELVQQILKDGHQIGNHGYAHLNGWKTDDVVYLEDVRRSSILIEKLAQDFCEISRFTRNDGTQFLHDRTMLFRPAYGKIKKSQILNLKSEFLHLKSEILILNWSLMPGDFDQNISSEKCYQNFQKVKIGDIIVLHDNEKSWKHLEYCLPNFLEEFKQYKFEKIG